MVTDIEIAQIFLTGCLAFLAILPSSLSITISQYRSELRKEDQDWESVKWHRRMVWSVIIILWMIVIGYFLSVFILVKSDLLAQLNLNFVFDSLLTPVGIMIMIISLAVLSIAGSFTIFALIIFNTDYNRGKSLLYTVYN